jgi:putative glycosyltransferase (TIGR04372 family)
MAIDNIVSRGGWVVRLGDSTMTKLPKMDRVIDMAHHPLKSALFDTYLTANCSYFIGTLSGMHEYSYLFSKPSLITNSFTYLATLPMKPNDIIIFKHVYSVSKNRFLTIREWLDAYQQINETTWTSTDWVYHDNTSEEILVAVCELLDGKKLGKSAPEQLEFKQLHLKSMVWVGEHFRFNNNDNLNSIHIRDQFRFFTQYISWKGNIGNDFLSRNW